VEERKWDAAEPVRQFVMTTSNLFLLRDDSTVAEKPVRTGTNELLTRPLTLPLTQIWEQPGDHAVLWTPPPDARLTDYVFCQAEGVLQCLRVGPGVAVVWQRLLRPGFRRPSWSDQLLLLPDRASVLAINGTNGTARWEATLPFEVVETQVCGDLYFVGNLRKGGAAALRLTTGELVWQQSLPLTVPGDGRENRARLAWDGERLHLFATAPRAGNDLKDFVVDVKSGAVVEARRFPKTYLDRRLYLVFGRQTAFFCTPAGEAFEYSLPDGKVTPHTRIPNAGGEEGISELKCSEPWILARTRSRRGRENERELHLR
jgi:hypothetical protein